MRGKVVAAVLMLWTATVEAGFVADFYDEAKTYGNVTEAGVLQSGALNTVTGGGGSFGGSRGVNLRLLR